MSVSQLKFSMFTKNSYNKPRFDHFDFVQIKNNTKTIKSYEVKKIVVKKIRKYDKINVIQYRIQ